MPNKRSRKSSNELIKIATDYGNRGWQVFPVQPGSKVPATPNGLKDASDDPSVIRELFIDKNQCNIGIRTGVCSNLVVLDIDAKSGGLDSLEQLVTEHGKIQTLCVQTGGGGFHFYFQAPSEPLKNRVDIRPGVDFRAEGGYVVAPPSDHASGNKYKFINDDKPAPIPNWLLTLVARPEKKRTKPSEKPTDIGEGGRNNYLTKVAGKMQRSGILTLEGLDAVNQRDCEPPLDDAELNTIFESVSRYEIEEEIDEDQDALNAFAAAKLYKENAARLHSWQEDFYTWTGTHYKRLREQDLFWSIAAFLQKQSEKTTSKITSRFVKDVIANLGALTVLPSDTKPPTNIGTLDGDFSRSLFLANGVLNLETKEFQEHSPEIFNLGIIPHKLDPDAKCPTWLKFLESCQPDQDTRDLLQEWFGYNLVFDTSMEKFALFEGSGANGKTVCCVVLRELVGPGNYSSVELEAFNPQRTFPLAETAGKLSNIVEELNELDKTAEGQLKKFVTGGSFTVERKHQHPFTLLPTAKLTFATNVLPRFTDRSEGIWRRLIYIPFRNTILDPEKQDRRLITSSFWQRSGELPGILNWALEGLYRLWERGYFKEPKITHEAKLAYRREMNPAAIFLDETYVATGTSSDEVSTASMYKAYQDFCLENGYRGVFSSRGLAEEVKRFFPKIDISPNPLYRDGVRTRVWRGIKERGEGGLTVVTSNDKKKLIE